jgi:hypothetical protein
MSALLFRYLLPSVHWPICKAGQGIESGDVSNSGQSGNKAGTFEDFLYQNGVIGCKSHESTIA